MNRVIEAVQFAAAKHGTQKRKGTGRPYTDHLYRVAGAVAERVNAINMMAEDLVVAALLHDTLEDTTATKEEISQKFGWQVLEYVVAMTKAKDDRPRRVRNAEYFERLKKALRAEISETTWASLHATKSRPFTTPERGKIAVKVINHYGDEVLKVYDVKG